MDDKMNRERIKLLDNFVDCLGDDDLRYVIGVAIPFRFRTEARRKSNEKANAALKVLRNPESNERQIICAKWDYFNNIKQEKENV